MFKVWSIIILGMTMLLTGLAVLSLDHRNATDEQNLYSGAWKATDGSGLKAVMSYDDKGYRLRIVNVDGTTIFSCNDGSPLNGTVVFRDMGQSGSAGQPFGCVAVKCVDNHLTVEGLDSGTRVFVKV